MTESMADRLKRIAREKKLAAEAAANVSSTVSSAVTESAAQGDRTEQSTGNTEVAVNSVPAAECEPATETVESAQDSVATDIQLSTEHVREHSTHPLAMQFAEIEQALLAKDPLFKVILRDIHNQLSKDPDLVTAMTEDEIGMIVRGLIVHANTEIVAPAAAKSAKAATKAASKKVIDVEDL